MDLLTETDAMLEISRTYAEDVSKKIADRQNDVRSMCFWNMYNRIKITQEILTFYDRSWKIHMLNVNDEDINSELVERIVTVTKNLFIDIVSMIEKTSKDTVDIYSGSKVREKAMEGNKYLYLRNIIQASCALKIVSKEDMQEWDDILIMRNLVAHNNSISDRSKKFMISGMSVSMRPGRMMKGPLNTFIVLSERSITLFYDWLNALDGL